MKENLIFWRYFFCMATIMAMVIGVVNMLYTSCDQNASSSTETLPNEPASVYYVSNEIYNDDFAEDFENHVKVEFNPFGIISTSSNSNTLIRDFEYDHFLGRSKTRPDFSRISFNGVLMPTGNGEATNQTYQAN
ncbi:MAG: hypothetical protein LBE79_05370 [Tannerella sp.]|nr:hypothetical protein [Tannerella sp.]